MKEIFLKIVKETAPHFTQESLSIPVHETGIDSIDLTVIRVALEKYYKHEIKDGKWFQFTTLEQVFEYFSTKSPAVFTDPGISRSIAEERNREIAMPQMANNGLSESWLLKEIGDIHWSLLSKGLGKKSSELKDENGNRLYATFTRISYSCSLLSFFKENTALKLKGSIKRFGSSIYISNSEGTSHDSFIEAILMTSFSIRTTEDNSKIEKSKLDEKINYIEEIKNTPEFLNDYRLLRKNLIEILNTEGWDFHVTTDISYTTQYHINPYYDINGVGLLYYAAYPIIVDTSLIEYFKEVWGNNDWVERYQTIYRNINYFANCNSNEKVVVNLHYFNIIDDKKIGLYVSLQRESDKILLAKIFTIKERL